MGKGDLEKAKTMAQNAIALDINCSDGYYYLALVRSAGHDFDEAVECMKRAILYDVDNPVYYAAMSRLYSEKSDYASAFEYIKEAQSLNQNSEEYKNIVHQAELFLAGKQTELMKQLMEQIQKYSDTLQFEKAARLRDSYLDLKKTLEKQKVVYENTKLNEDVISLMAEDGIFAIVILMVREGRLIDKKDFVYEVEEEDRTEFFATFFKEYYSTLSLEFPDKVISNELEAVGEKALYEEWLEILAGKKVKISYGKSAQGKELQSLADKNAKVVLDNAKIAKMSKIRDDFNEIGSYLAEKLRLKNFPHRIECYDISHIQGTNTVASMVTFINGLSKKSEYKKFKIKTTEGKPDDFLSMKEVLTRRLSHLGEKNWDKPDLMIIDGGKGQLSSVMEIIKELGVEGIDVVSLAKRNEEVFLPKQSEPVILPRNSSALFLFQRIRDEAHRFAITYHRNLRSKALKHQ